MLLLLLSVVVVVVIVVVVDSSVGQWTGLEGGKYVGMIGRTMDGNILQGGEEELVFLIVIVCVFILRLRGRMENVEIDLFLMMTMIDLFFVYYSTGPSRMMCGRLVVLLLPFVFVVVGRGSIAIPGGGNGGFILYFYFFVFFAVLFFTQ